jgi:hypothetical protein
VLEEPRIEVLPPAYDGFGNGDEPAAAGKGGAKKGAAAKGKKGKAGAAAAEAEADEPKAKPVGPDQPREERRESFTGGDDDQPGRAFSLRDIRR